MASTEGTEERLKAALADRYCIEREIGSGGMATVYLAEDLKHHRKVAVKVLKPELSAVVGTERFLAEIRTTANLSHPHILPLHDSGEADGFLFYVMPYVKGESLREKLDGEGQLPVEEAVRIAGRVADALDHAHRQHVIHRDIKPANILFQDDEPVVSDFGIALAVSAAGEGRLTETGLSLGTPFYMSPEQAAGEDTPTAASDVYSLGCVLYEMLTGDPPHTGSSAQAILGKILLGEVTRPTKLRRTIPTNVEGAILKALERLPADRFASTGDLAEALKDKGFRHGVGVGSAPDGGAWRRVALGLGATLVTLAVAVLWFYLSKEPPQVTRHRLALPSDSGLVMSYGPSVALSPDGSKMVYVGPGVESSWSLWVQEFDQLSPEAVPGTDGAYQPFFSPDGEQVGFIAFGDAGVRTLKVVSLRGGSPLELVAIPRRGGGAWGLDGFIYVAAQGGRLGRVRETGGEVVPVTALAEGEIRHRWPDVIPNGRALVFTVMRSGSYDYGDASIAVADLETGGHHTLLPGVLARYSATGHLLVVGTDGTLRAAPFDEDNLTVGDPVAVAEDVFPGRGTGALSAADLAVSASGTLAYVAGRIAETGGELVWVERSGNEHIVDPDWGPGNFRSLALSPDDQRLAVRVQSDGVEQIWVKGLPSGPLTALTTDTGPNRRPTWSADGRTVAYIHFSLSDTLVARIRSDGSDVGRYEVLLDRDRPVFEAVYTPDERGMIFREGLSTSSEGDHGDLGYWDLEGDSVVEGLLASDFNERAIALSPDGRWLAYVSDVQGRDEVYVRPFPFVGAGRTQISRNGGREPVWAHNGRELFYRDLSDGWLTVASCAADSGFAVQGWERLFDATGYEAFPHWHGYDVTRDDARFIFVRSSSSGTEDLSLVLFQNFFTELKERMRERR